MKLVKQDVKLLDQIDGNQLLKKIELAGRVCYKSEDKITDTSCFQFVKMLINLGHEAMIEHCSISVLCTTSRGVSHEIVRHRIASYAQESTRYCSYNKDKFSNQLTFIIPSCFNEVELKNDSRTKQFTIWKQQMKNIEDNYFTLISLGQTAQEARGILPNDLKTEIVITMNLREWRHFFKLRLSKAAHPDIQELSLKILTVFKELVPIIFDDITE